MPEDRTLMIQRREAMGMSRSEMADICKVSAALIRIIEEGSVTMPSIAARIGGAYGMDLNEARELTTAEHRSEVAARLLAAGATAAKKAKAKRTHADVVREYKEKRREIRWIADDIGIRCNASRQGLELKSVSVSIGHSDEWLYDVLLRGSTLSSTDVAALARVLNCDAEQLVIGQAGKNNLSKYK